MIKTEEKVLYEDAPDNENFYCRKVSDEIEVGVYPVLYGDRIRASYLGDGRLSFDYCAGNNPAFVEVLYGLVLACLKKKIPFKEFPPQDVKPFYNDPHNFAKLIALAGDDYKCEHIHNVRARREIFLANILKNS
jgi:hypothetical protein